MVTNSMMSSYSLHFLNFFFSERMVAIPVYQYLSDECYFSSDDSTRDPDFLCSISELESSLRSESDDESDFLFRPKKRKLEHNVNKAKKGNLIKNLEEKENISDSEDDSSMSDIISLPCSSQFNTEVESKREFGLLPKGMIKEGCKQIYDKQNYCTFCSKNIKSKISRHILTHKLEPKVMKILSLPKKSKERKVELELLANEGNFKHNLEVLKKKEGLLVVARRDSQSHHNPNDFLPCEYCKKFILKKNLWLHHRTCPIHVFYEKNRNVERRGIENEKSNNAVRRGYSLLHSGLIDEDVSVHVVKMLDRMRNDGVKDVVMNDSLIKKYAALRVESLGSKEDQKIGDMHRISQCCRILGRLIIECKKLNLTAIINLDRLVSPPNFDLIVSATQTMSVSGESPAISLGSSIGNILGHIIQIKTGEALRSNDEKRSQEASDFQKLFESEWNYRVNAVCTRRKNTLNRKRVQVLPLTEDLQTLREFIMSKMKSTSSKLKKTKKPCDWVELAKLTLTRLILFNKRRRAEVKDLKVLDYQCRPDWKTEQKGEFEMALTSADKILANR